MSFRVRVLALIVVVIVTATGSTAWLTWRTATQQMQRTVSAGAQDIQTITAALAAHGRAHDGWTGVEPVVRTLAARTGQRIRLVTDAGRAVADSDELAGGPARPVAGPPLLVDVRPQLQLPATPEQKGEAMVRMGGGVKLTATAISQYHYNRRLKRCLTDAGLTISTSVGPNGLEVIQAAKASRQATVCESSSQAADQDFRAYVTAAEACSEPTEAALRDCFQRTFLQQIAPVSPEPLRVYIGASTDPLTPVPVTPIAVAAAIVALIALLGVVMVSRRVLRPVRALTAAVNELGEGRRLSDRVPVAGRDELAMLSRAFNRMAQALEESEERQRRMTADIAHELRTPLTNLRGYLEALTDGTATPSRELFLSLRDEALLQQRIIDDLQDLALAEAGRLTYRRERVDLAELVEAYPQQHFAAGVSVTAHTGGQALVDGDPDRLRQVVNNLMRNAVTACVHGGQITLAARVQAPWVELTVSDTGSGIAEEDLPHIFERFWRADRARPRGSGAGLGLAIVRQIVADHGGTIGVTSERGRGTTFTLKLPHAGMSGSDRTSSSSRRFSPGGHG